MEPATVQTVRTKASARPTPSKAAAVFRKPAERFARGRTVKSEISASVGRHYRRQCSVGLFEWICAQPTVERP